MLSAIAIQTNALPSEIREAARRSWCLIPVLRKGKKPLVKSWPQAATADISQLEAWAAQFPGCNWGVATGLRSGVFILDIDGEAGEDALRAYALNDWHLPATLTVSTGRGRHLYFRYPVSRGIRNSAGKLSLGLDIRGNGGFAVLPPSIHACGSQYRYQEPMVPVADAPGWLLDLVCSPQSAPSSVFREGFRNNALARIGGRLRRRGADFDGLAAKLLSENALRCDPPLPTPEVVNIAKSISRYAVGGPDVLDSAWGKVQAESHGSTEAKFLALMRHLAEALPGQPVALPLERIAEHMGCNWTLIRRYRKRAIDAGLIREVEPYVPHKTAAVFEVIDD